MTASSNLRTPAIKLNRTELAQLVTERINAAIALIDGSGITQFTVTVGELSLDISDNAHLAHILTSALRSSVVFGEHRKVDSVVTTIQNHRVSDLFLVKAHVTLTSDLERWPDQSAVTPARYYRAGF